MTPENEQSSFVESVWCLTVPFRLERCLADSLMKRQRRNPLKLGIHRCIVALRVRDCGTNDLARGEHIWTCAQWTRDGGGVVLP